jgi:acyl dehydratase
MAVLMASAAGDFIRGGGINLAMIVHGEQRLTIAKPLPPAGRMTSQARCLSVIDKGSDKGALLNVEVEIRDATSGAHHAISLMTLYCRGDGGFGGQTTGELPLHAVPEGPHNLEIAMPTLPQQAAIYRLLGDRTALHIDPEAAQAVGFARPILHGLCTYGIVCRAILAACCGNDPTMIEQLDVRFSAPVYPGDTLVTQMWRDGNRISFECWVAEREARVIRNGFCRLRDRSAMAVPS